MQYNIVNKKGINYQCIKTTWIKLRNIMKAGKKIGHKKYALWFHSCEILEMEKLTIVAEKRSVVSWYDVRVQVLIIKGYR